VDSRCARPFSADPRRRAPQCLTVAALVLSLAAVFVGLWLAGTEVNITAMAGMTMLVGIVMEIRTICYSKYHEMPEGTDVVQGLTHAGKNRMRPTMMTSLPPDHAQSGVTR